MDKSHRYLDFICYGAVLGTAGLSVCINLIYMAYIFFFATITLGTVYTGEVTVFGGLHLVIEFLTGVLFLALYPIFKRFNTTVQKPLAFKPIFWSMTIMFLTGLVSTGYYIQHVLYP